MYKILLIFILLTTSLYSSETNNVELVKQYKKALSLFNEKKYQESYDIFNKLFIDNLDNAKINFYLGRSSFELRRYSEAIIAYDRVLFQEPNNLRVKLELARSFFMYKSYRESKRVFTEIKNDKHTSPKVIKVVNRYIKLIDKKNSKHSLDTMLMFGLTNDSNINNTADPHTFGSFTYDETKEKASSNQEVAVINYKYKMSNSLSNNYSGLFLNRSMFNDKYRSNNIKLWRLTASLNKIYSKKFIVNYEAAFDSIYQDKMHLLKTYALLPSINYIYDNKLIIKGHFKHQYKEYQQDTDNQKDSNINELGSQLINLYSKKIINTIGLTYTRERKKRGTRTDISNRSYEISLKNQYIYKNNIIFSTTLSYDRAKYDDLNQIFNLNKENKTYKLNFSNIYMFNKNNILQTSINFLKQDSNMKTEVYKKNTYTMNIIRKF